jgi:glycosyltransferase involved in cell wall biosynthesis
MSVALVTNYLPAYRLPLYELLAQRLGVEVHCFGGEGHFVPEAMRDLDRQLADAPFPAHRLARQSDAFTLGQHHGAVIASVAGRMALPASYFGAHRRGRPFVLWASLWRHPRTPAHLLSYPLMRRLYRRSDAVLTYGPHVSSYVADQRGNSDRVFVAPQAVEPELFARPVTDEEMSAWRRGHGLPDGPLVLFVGRLEPDKGVRVLLEAWRRLGDADAALCLVGDGPLGAEVSRVRERGVHLAGRLPRDELAVAYAAADVVVVPSSATRRFLEPWGLVCNEAMLQGRPVVASTAVGAVAGGLVRDGETGLVVEQGDARSLADAIARLLAEAQLRELLGQAGREEVSGYTYERAAEAFERALSAVGAV